MHLADLGCPSSMPPRSLNVLSASTRTFVLRDAVEAHRALESRATAGQVLLIG
jgi:hypothetical protein